VTKFLYETSNIKVPNLCIKGGTKAGPRNQIGWKVEASKEGEGDLRLFGFK
jgi:hypothetical protein